MRYQVWMTSSDGQTELVAETDNPNEAGVEVRRALDIHHPVTCYVRDTSKSLASIGAGHSRAS
jgi:hypothetical protein